MKALIPIAGILCLLMITGCDDRDYVLDQRVEVGNEAWTWNDPIKYSFQIDDTSSIYRLILGVDHSTSFPFQNLYTRVTTKYPDGEAVADTVSLEIADHRGVWYGNCDRTDCELEINLQERIRFDQTGQYHLIFEQFTRRDSLPGISSLSLQLIRNTSGS